jgi:threonine synthase
MKYRSTRGDEKQLSFEQARPSSHYVTFLIVEQTVLAGLAPDGGLFIPVEIPALPEDWETAWEDLSFVDLAVNVLSLYISPDEISKDELRQLLAASYSTFRHQDITPIHTLDDKTLLLELFHGPTFAFKDVALQFLGNLFEFFLKRRNVGKQESEKEKLTVLGATSGDTGRQASSGYMICSLSHTFLFQCRHIWSQKQGRHLYLYPLPRWSRLPDPRSPDGYSYRCQRSQRRRERNIRRLPGYP